MPPSPVGDEAGRELAGRCLAGSPGAWGDFVRRCGPAAATAARTLFARWGIPLSEPDLDDIVQETMLMFLRADCRILRVFRWECSLATYVRSVAVNRCVDARRRLGFERSGLARLRAAHQEDLRAGGAGRAPEEALSRSEDVASLRRAMERLAPRERRALAAFHWEGASTREVAGMLSVSEENARAILSRARKRMREILQESGVRRVTTGRVDRPREVEG